VLHDGRHRPASGTSDRVPPMISVRHARFGPERSKTLTHQFTAKPATKQRHGQRHGFELDFSAASGRASNMTASRTVRSSSSRTSCKPSCRTSCRTSCEAPADRQPSCKMSYSLRQGLTEPCDSLVRVLRERGCRSPHRHPRRTNVVHRAYRPRQQRSRRSDTARTLLVP
jgi:hypothetical protein